MTLMICGDEIVCSKGHIRAPYPIFDVREIEGRVFVLYDYMAFPRGEPARNLFAYDLSGNPIWRAEDIGFGATDAYTNIISETPLVVCNFAGFTCIIDMQTGKVSETTLTK